MKLRPGLWIFLGGAAFAIWGCNAPSPAPTPAPGSEIIGSAQPVKKPTPAITAKPTTPAKTPPKPTNAPAEASTKGDIPERLYQLRDLKTVTVNAPKHALRLWVMDDEGKRQEGMMFLHDKDVAADQGMLFIFDSPGPQGFWMQNTLIPLDIIYIDDKGKVLNIAEGKVQDETSLPSKGNAEFVIELKQGQAQQFGIGPGTVFASLPSMKM